MPIVRRKLDVNTVYPANLRYNLDTDTVQSLVNGDWVDNPQADPRTQTTLPARITSDPACDAARSVADALKNQLDQTVEAVNNAKTAFTIAGLILGLFTFGVFDIFVAIALGIANAMIDAGGTALAAALTPTVFDTLTDILFCAFGSDGRLKDGGLDQAMSDVSDMIGGLGATIINAMLALAGEGGVNNLAALGTSTGDCSDADCGCGDETIADTINVYFGGDVVKTGCNIKADALTDGSLKSISATWDGTHPWKLTHEALVSGSTGTSQWQWTLAAGGSPIISGTAPIGVSIQTLELSSLVGNDFRVTWDVATP